MIGKTVSHYKIIEQLGAGGMGIVYKAEDSKLKRTVALKFLPPSLSIDSEAKNRFIHEAQAASALDHNNICTIYEIDETDDHQLFMAMSCYDGETLKQKIEHGPLPFKEASSIVSQIARGLAKAHEKGIIHRDIKPANIIITNDSVVKILDFGLAKLSGRTMLTKEGTTLGTVSYMSPEQTRGDSVDHRTDIWSLGIIFYEMLTGQQPYRGEYDQAVMYSILNEEPVPPSTINPDISDRLEQIIIRTLAKNPDDRFQDMGDIIDQITALQKEKTSAFSFKKIIKMPKILIPAILVLTAVILFAIWWTDRSGNISWAVEEAIPQIEQYMEGTYLGGLAPAYELAVQAEKYIPDNQKLLDLISNISVVTSIESDPPGAPVYLKPYNEPKSEWLYAGLTPIDSIRLARDFYRFKFEKDGYQTVHAVATTFFMSVDGWIPIPLKRTLIPDSLIPDDMVLVEGDDTEHGHIPDFYMDKYEVTNLQYKEFIAHGGYSDSIFWRQPLVRNGKTISWSDAMSSFTDATGRPGPATWQAGDYPEGQDNYPVSGICWYEAAAYAEYVGKRLPSITHWSRAASLDKAFGLLLFPTYLYPMSNFSDKGPKSIGSNDGVNFYGVYDMAGNVREFCWNETSPGIRCVRGGAWDDAPYLTEVIGQASDFDRSPKNGFRCVRYLHENKIPEQVFEPWEGYFKTWDYRNIQIASDEVFKIYKDQFSYERLPLNVKVEKVDTSNTDWIVEKVSFDAAYNKERIYADLYLPRHVTKPYQTLIFFPGSMAIDFQSFEQDWLFSQLRSFIMKNGRAIMLPAYQGTYGRKVEDAMDIHVGKPTRRYVEYLIQVVKDFRRSVDYLESRPDVDSEKIGYYGFSWGGLVSPVITSVEDRLKVSVIPLAGLRAGGILDIHPAADPLNYVSHVKIPTLMLSGKYDPLFPYETVVKPMYELLGTPDNDKMIKLYKTDHFIPRNELIREILAWLDKYLGPVNK